MTEETTYALEKEEESTQLCQAVVYSSPTMIAVAKNEDMIVDFTNDVVREKWGKQEDATKLKQQFLSNMSHEIRTPMNAIIGFTNVMLRTDLSAKQKEYLTAIKVSGDALIVLINDILDLEKLDAGKITFEKQLVEPQRGSIRVESELNEGSRFNFISNFQKTINQTETVNDIVELDPEIKDIKVLVAEDMPLNQLLMRTLLDDFGFSADVASNGKLAIEKLATKQYDIILMDLQMPEMNGFETTKYIRDILKSNIPIIALTADVTTVDIIKCKEAGMNDYISKPVDERLLYSRIVKLIKNPVVGKTIVSEEIKYTDLSYLMSRTKADPALMMEMINLYLQQTPPLIMTMKQGLKDKNWVLLASAVHKMIPSFSIVGMKSEFEKIAKKIQEYADAQQLNEEIHDLVLQLENACGQACQELKEELERINSAITSQRSGEVVAI